MNARVPRTCSENILPGLCTENIIWTGPTCTSPFQHSPRSLPNAVCSICTNFNLSKKLHARCNKTLEQSTRWSHQEHLPSSFQGRGATSPAPLDSGSLFFSCTCPINFKWHCIYAHTIFLSGTLYMPALHHLYQYVDTPPGGLYFPGRRRTLNIISKQHCRPTHQKLNTKWPRRPFRI